jgi:hypothetical protein
MQVSASQIEADILARLEESHQAGDGHNLQAFNPAGFLRSAAAFAIKVAPIVEQFTPVQYDLLIDGVVAALHGITK